MSPTLLLRAANNETQILSSSIPSVCLLCAAGCLLFLLLGTASPPLALQQQQPNSASRLTRPLPRVLGASATALRPTSPLSPTPPRSHPGGEALAYETNLPAARQDVPTSARSPAAFLSVRGALLLALPLLAAAALRNALLRPAQPLHQWHLVAIDGPIDVSAEVADMPTEPPSAPAAAAKEPRLCCPTCFRPLTGNVCRSCSLEYMSEGPFIDLTPASGRPVQIEGEAEPPKKDPLLDQPFFKAALPFLEQFEKVVPAPFPRVSRILKGEYVGDKPEIGKTTFESPIVASVYERGWRQSFSRAGFPGVDAEFAKAMAWLRPAVAEGPKVILDLSCGSGLFTRRFVACGEFTKVFALDFSENMLLQTRQGFDKDPTLSRQAVEVDLELVRGDVARLPFPTDSLPAIHAGAAIHCWPSPTLGMLEIARVLKPGGRLVFSTFLVPGQDNPLLDDRLRSIFVTPARGSGIRYWEVSELQDLCARAGLTGVEVERRRNSVIMKAEKRRVG